MDSSVVLAHRLGQSIIVGQCIGINPATGQSIVFSEDRVIVHVVPFDRVEIKTPLIRIRTGAIMPATIWGTPNISPMILGTLNDLKVKWSTNQPDVIDILDIFSEAGVEYEDIDSISVRVRALNPGRAKIQAEVETPNGRQTCAVDVIVFKMLELESPKRITSDAIIVPPNSVVNLKANLPDTSFKFNEESVGGLKISAEGVLRTTEAIGRDLVIVSIATASVQLRAIHLICFNSFRRRHPKIKLSRFPSKWRISIMFWWHCIRQPSNWNKWKDVSQVEWMLCSRSHCTITWATNSFAICKRRRHSQINCRKRNKSLSNLAAIQRLPSICHAKHRQCSRLHSATQTVWNMTKILSN